MVCVGFKIGNKGKNQNLEILHQNAKVLIN